MADPILPDIYKAQVVLAGKSGLPEDVYVNNWYFRNDDTISQAFPSVRGAIKRVLDSFYTVADSAGRKVSQYMSGYISTNSLKYRIYDLGQAPPRTRNEEAGAPFTPSTSTLPLEVAMCLSFFAGTNQPRNRGRIYLGPLASSAVLTSSGSLPVPTTGMLECIADRASAVGRTTENVTWVMVTRGGTKPPFDPPNAKVVTGGWVDSAWDTQRRRGVAATGRTLWSAV